MRSDSVPGAVGDAGVSSTIPIDRPAIIVPKSSSCPRNHLAVHLAIPPTCKLTPFAKQRGLAVLTIVVIDHETHS